MGAYFGDVEFIASDYDCDGVFWQVNFSSDSGSNYNVTKTSTFIRSYHDEADADTIVQYYGDGDLAQGTGVQRVTGAGIGNDNDQSVSGVLQLFNPSSTTYIKHFIIDSNSYANSDYSTRSLVAGYCNTTSAINAIRFTFATGNIDAGTIYLYGIK